jgi:protein MBA1
MIPNAKGKFEKNGDGIIQAVVRIHSLQSLRHVKRVWTKEKGRGETTKEVLVDAQGRELPPEKDSEEAALKDAKELVEYFVVQKSVRKGKEGNWMLWGTAEETTLAAVENRESSEGKAQKAAAQLGSA